MQPCEIWRIVLSYFLFLVTAFAVCSVDPESMKCILVRFTRRVKLIVATHFFPFFMYSMCFGANKRKSVNPRILRIQREHANLHTNSNSILGSNQRPWTCEVAMLLLYQDATSSQFLIFTIFKLFFLVNFFHSCNDGNWFSVKLWIHL